MAPTGRQRESAVCLFVRESSREWRGMASGQAPDIAGAACHGPVRREVEGQLCLTRGAAAAGAGASRARAYGQRRRIITSHQVPSC